MNIKRLSGTLCFVLIILSSWAQGWRKDEMEIKVHLNNVVDTHALMNLGIGFEPASQDGSVVRCYVVPGELQKLQAGGLRCEVVIPDLNKRFEHFWDNPSVPPGYYTYDQIIAIADSLATNFPSICKKVIWGTSLGGRQLAALKISDNVSDDEPEPEIMFDGGIHGDEVGGAQNIIMFARDLCLAYGTDSAITSLVNNREIWLYLMVNPDGRVAMSRYNNNYVDINRDMGYMWDGQGQSPKNFSQVETRALRNCILDNQFVVYTNYHSGTETIAYPWSYRSDPSRDNAHISQLAGIYSTSSGYANLIYGQGFNIMYQISGSTKDFQYGSLGNIGWSIEISVDKQPPSSLIMTYYNYNKPAMLEIINRCGWGVTGTVTDSVTGEPVRASIWVSNYFPVYTDPAVGDYHKYVLPGTYTIKVVANGYKTKTITGVTVPAQGAVTTDFQLVPLSKRYAYMVTSCQVPGNNFGDEGYTPGALGEPDGIPYSLGRYGWIDLDMGDTVYDGSGIDFKVYQAGTNNKNFTVSGSLSKDGPYMTIGTGNGTTGFDISLVGMTKVRYLEIYDGATGPSAGSGAGFNLDAVEMITPPLIPAFTASNTKPCPGTPVDFTDRSSGVITSWHWSFPGGTPSSSTQQNPAGIAYHSPGDYDVTLTITNSVSSVTKTKTSCIQVTAAPMVELGNDTAICAWSAITLDAGNPGSSYLWSTGSTTQTIQVDSTGVGLGSADFWVAATNPAGCTSTDTISLTFDDCTGVDDRRNEEAISVFPNPATLSLSIAISGIQEGSWQLYTPQGSPVAGGNFSSSRYQTTVDVSSLPRGVYLFDLKSKGKHNTRKVILMPEHK